jgi:hypothetical protein
MTQPKSVDTEFIKVRVLWNLYKSDVKTLKISSWTRSWYFTPKFAHWQHNISFLQSIEVNLPLSSVPIKPMSSLPYWNQCAIGIEELPTSVGPTTFSTVGPARKGIFSFPYFLHAYLTIVGVGHSPKWKVGRATCINFYSAAWVNKIKAAMATLHFFLHSLMRTDSAGKSCSP